MRTNFQEWLSRMISKMEMLLEKTDLYAQFGQGWTIFCHAGIGWGVGKSTSLYRNAAKICNISTVVHGSSRGKAGFNLYVCQSRPTFSVSDSPGFYRGKSLNVVAPFASACQSILLAYQQIGNEMPHGVLVFLIFHSVQAFPKNCWVSQSLLPCFRSWKLLRQKVVWQHRCGKILQSVCKWYNYNRF